MVSGPKDFGVISIYSPLVYEETDIVGQDGQIYKGRVTRKNKPPGGFRVSILFLLVEGLACGRVVAFGQHWCVHKIISPYNHTIGCLW